MIDVKNLTKIYQTGKNEVVALKSVSFHLPNKGLVFIVGKSGSGKSTLLNMLGVLDDITSGEIIFDGKDIAHISDHDANTYRNNYLGIVYQNYNLFETETVAENIKLGIGVSTQNIPEDKVDEMLKVVELEDIKTKKCKNLSGGQKQRVAIARALVKDPKLILADEPTGNLDSKTAKTIFELFRKVANEKLVVIITHDIKSAYEYADRIIRLSDGEIVDDLIRNEKYTPELDNDFIYVEPEAKLSEEEIAKINKNPAFSHRKLKKMQKKFRKYTFTGNEGQVTDKFHDNKTSFKQVLRLGLKNLKHNKFSLIVTSILTVLIVALLSLSTAFINFEGESATRDVVKIYDTKTIVMKKSYSLTNKTTELEKDYVIETGESDLVPLKEAKYKGNHYPIYNISMPVSGDLFIELEQNAPADSDRFYWQAASGVVVADNALLEHLFGENFELAAGSLYGLEESTKLIVTDYFADGLVYYNSSLVSKDKNDPYAEVVNTSFMGGRYQIGAVIKTNYKEKHGLIYNIHEKYTKDLIKHSEALDLVRNTRSYQIFVDDLLTRLNYGFSLNPKFFEEHKKEMPHSYFGNSFIAPTESSTQYEYVKVPRVHAYVDEEMEGNDIRLSADIYNELFGTSAVNKSSPDFKEKVIYIHNFGFDQDVFSTPKHSARFVVKDLYTPPYATAPIMYCSQAKITELQEFYQFIYGFMFDDVYDSYALYDALIPDYFFCPQFAIDAVYNTINITTIFDTIFTSIFGVLIAIEMLLIILHVNKTINKEKYAFGVYKTLGYSNRHLNIAILLSNAITMLIIFVGSTIATLGLSFLANYLLQNGFYLYTHNILYYEIKLLAFKFLHVLLYNAVVLGALLLSFLIPLLKIRKIKPTNIIREAKS